VIQSYGAWQVVTVLAASVGSKKRSTFREYAESLGLLDRQTTETKDERRQRVHSEKERALANARRVQKKVVNAGKIKTLTSSNMSSSQLESLFEKDR